MSTTLFSDFKVSVSVGGRVFNDVSSVAVDLVASSIPTVTASLVPEGIEKGVDPDGGAVISVITLEKIAALYRDMMRLKDSGASTDLSIAVDVSDSDPIDLKLSGWIVTGVGVGSGKRKGDLVVAIEFRHPVQRLVSVPGCAPSVASGDDSNTDLDPTTTGTYTDVLGLLTQAVRSAGERAKAALADAMDNGDVATYVVTELNKGADLIAKHLQWGNGGGMPTDPMLASALVWHATDSAASAASSGASLWTWLSMSVFQPYFLHVRSTYLDEALVVEPFNPWGEPADVIDASEVSKVSHPTSDVLPLRGLFAVYDSLVAAGSTSSDSFGANPPEYKQRTVLYAPAGLKESKVGQLAHVRMRDWVMATHTILSAKAASFTPDSATEDKSPTFATAGDATQASIASTVLQQEFAGLYMMNHTMMITTRYRPELVAGTVYSINKVAEKGNSPSKQDDAFTEEDTTPPFFTFYATRVNHIISSDSKTCMTQLQGAYVRSADVDGSATGTFIPENFNVIYGE